MFTLVAFIVIAFLAFRFYVPKYKSMTNLLVLRSKELLQNGTATVYLLQPQQGSVVSRIPNIGRLVPKIDMVISYIQGSQLILEAAIGGKLVPWGTYIAEDVPELDPNKRSIRLRDRTFLVLSIDPDEFADIMWTAKLPPEAVALQYREQLYDEIQSM